MKKRYIVGIILYVLAVVYGLTAFIDTWYWSFAFALAPALVGYVIGAILDNHHKSDSVAISEGADRRSFYRWTLSATVLVLAVVEMFLGFFGNTHDTFFTLGVVVYVILPTSIAFVIGYLIDKLGHHTK